MTKVANDRVMETPAETVAPGQLITRSEEPPNLEMPFPTLDSFITPNERFYVRCHFPIPQIALKNWKLKIEGPSVAAFELSYEDLQGLPQHTLTATMECAGNARSHLEPKVKGVAWDMGAVGNAEWSGVLLRDVLVQAGATTGAVEVILEGADRGAIKEPPRPPGAINYARSLPIEKAREDVLLALRMNGEPLSPSHGFPLRAVVPGWFGMASVKWLQRIVFTETPFNGYYQSIDYSYWSRRDGLAELVPLREMQVKAQIARPALGEILDANSEYPISGAAWAADDDVTEVEVSSDGGASWARAELMGEPLKHAWRFWQFSWKTPSQPGRYILMARATDSLGQTQPRERVAEYGTYMINHWLPITVEVR